MSAQNQKLIEKLILNKVAWRLSEVTDNIGHPEVRIDSSLLKKFCWELKINPGFDFDLFLSVTAVDYMDKEFIKRPDTRFEIVYHLLSLKHKHRLRIKVAISEAKPEIDSVANIWLGANFMEREVWDMYGIKFIGHPDLRRILMYDEFKGYPLRKDYPILGKQPRVPLLHPEVHNTAKDRIRLDLVKINTRKEANL